MKTPIFDFVQSYSQQGLLRLHMPGHKGLGEVERMDLTEVQGADSLYEADGIIAESEANASQLFGCPTFYSTEGSSQCIRAMVYLAMCHARQQGKTPKFAAGRNVHKTFLSAVALLDVDVTWLYAGENYLSCPITAAHVEALGEEITALYVTSPDYLGNMVDIAAIAQVCRRKGILLLVDNAHGAYLRFLQPSLHPMDLGADLCCDSAHKTLPVLTGGAYLHIRQESMAKGAKKALGLFGSTSPSYLILASLDKANGYLAQGYGEKLEEFVKVLAEYKAKWQAVGQEPMKITLPAKAYGYTGTELADALRTHGMECEFADPDYVVLMPTPEIGVAGLEQIHQALCRIPQRAPLETVPPALCRPERVCSVRQALLAPERMLPVAESLGKVLSSASVGCPPAVPILVCGERIDENAIACFQYYGIDTCCVVEE